MATNTGERQRDHQAKPLLIGGIRRTIFANMSFQFRGANKTRSTMCSVNQGRPILSNGSDDILCSVAPFCQV